MKNKTGENRIHKHKIAVSLVLTIALGLLCMISYQQAINETTQMVKIPVASKMLGSRTIITKEDFVYIDVPKCVIFDNVYLNEEEIVGKYIKPYQSVAQNSLFYSDVLAEKDSMNDASLFFLQEGEVAISIDVDIKTSYANSILVGHVIDLYFLGKVNFNKSAYEESIVHGEVVKNVRVIAVKDKEGKSIESDTSLESSVLVVALSREDAHVVGVAKAMGNVTPIISYDNINQVDSKDYYDYQKIRNIILGNSLDVTLVPLDEGVENG